MPRVRQQLWMSRTDGSARYGAELIEDDATFAERMAGLKASLPDIGPVEARSIALTCDGCGTMAELGWDDPRLPDGWTERPDGDYCPDC
jgi:hypothetical protein